MEVEIAYALPERQYLFTLEVVPGCTVEQALEQSTLSVQLPDLNWRAHTLGIFGKPATLTTILSPHDRIEIYRPLQADPKALRQQRVRRNRRAIAQQLQQRARKS